ncbi:electron transfer flavoprotein-ubiquinone oxidoreductase [Enterobacteriaceae bacterium H20N1]|uniref:Electron transfer flavoprotein-ubiquinone oxidoreductase n=1 Tax=Dryocola boscaweniae TaxID=2925397 RepID=A0A9X2W8G1_9ENTR|nr:electron transfer flavoprotein-ubiquinone oxidoreductase [Dryocola boscaweniae]MCT4702073.1 electron transfer flavoprotein-ubiquinone oxidoreductase [Dryocola boscaweniae]MCT4719483.1 electron transfer flavoprotein-ubiquinone oxidoreductase [Dryocola boscaweniae]
MEVMVERETMEFDVLIVGGGPAGLSAACRLMQMAQREERQLSVCVIEKGAEIGAHILSGALFEPRALNELFPDWQQLGAPLNTPVTEDELLLLRDGEKARKIPAAFIPAPMHNEGNYVISLADFCRWLARQAESLGVDIFPGFAAASILYDDAGAVAGVTTGDMGLNAKGEEKPGFTPGMNLQAKYTLFAEGCRGHLGKQLIANYQLDAGSDPQHYALGIKELWDIPPEKSRPGHVIHASGWPLNDETSGGSFLYHTENNQVVVGLIVDLNYRNPWLSPFDEFQRMKHHPAFSETLSGGKRISYGARAITKGGINALPKMHFPGGLLIGCDAGTLNFAKIKGSHTAMKSGMLAAEAVYQALAATPDEKRDLSDFAQAFSDSWLGEELRQSRNFGPLLHRFGTVLGGAFNYIEQNWFKGKLPFTLHDRKADNLQLRSAKQSTPISYPKPDNQLSFDKLSSVYLANTSHDEDQPCHLKLKDAGLSVRETLPLFAEPAQRYCPAGVYEIITLEGKPKLQINAQNCVHCKTCDIKDPFQNIVWTAPEGGSGPNYPNM